MRSRRWLIGAAALAGAVVLGAVVVSQTVRFNDIRDRMVQDAERTLGRSLAIEGDMRLDLLRRTPSLTVAGVRLGNREGGTAADMLTAERLEVAVELWPLLSGELHMRHIELEGVRLLLETDGDGRGNWEFGEGTGAPGGGRGTLPTIEALHLSEAEILLRSGRDGSEWQLAVDRLSLEMQDGHAGLAVAGEGRIADRVVTVAGTVGSLRAMNGAGTPFPVDLTLELGPGVSPGVSEDGLRGRISGQVADLVALQGVELHIGLEGSLGGVAALSGLALPEGQPVRLDARLQDARPQDARPQDARPQDGGPQDARPQDGGSQDGGSRDGGSRDGEAGWLLDLAEARLGDSDVAGRLVIRPPAGGSGGRLLRVEAELASDRIVPDALMPPGREVREPAADRSGRVIPDLPLPGLTPLTWINGRLDWTVARLETAQTVLHPVSLGASLEDGLLLVERLEATVPGGGAVALRLEVDAGARPARLSARLQTERFDLGRLLADLGASDMLTGALSGEVALAGRGETTRAVLASLEGGVSLAMMNGQLRNRFAELLAADLVRALVPVLVQGERTAVNCLIGRFDVAAGVAQSRLLLLDTPRMTVLGDGSVDLGRERLDLLLAPRARDASLVSLAVPLRVRGSFADPSVGPDEMGMARRLGSLALGLVNPLMLIPALSDLGTGDSNPCVTAIGETAAELGTPALEDAVRGVGEGIGDAVRGIGGGIGEGLRGIFGR